VLLGALATLEPGVAASLRIHTGIGTAPADGLVLDDVMDAARRRASEAEFSVASPSGLFSAAASEPFRQGSLFDDALPHVMNPWRRAS
jgi:hypothetical protein